MSKVFTRNYLWMVVLLSIMAVLLGGISRCPAAIVATGNVEPVGTWTTSTTGYVARTSDGSLLVDAGSALQSYRTYIGYSSGASGAATVTGAGSTWTNSNILFVGYYNGTGTLTVADGGEVTAGTLYASLGNLLGNGKITATQGAVLDADLRFDAAHSAQATVTFGSGGTLTVNVADGDLGVGYKGNGSLTVVEGVAVTSSAGVLGFYPGSSGSATITGAGSKWTNSFLNVGFVGAGTLYIEAGGQVNNSIGYLGNHPGSSGTATVTGIGSKWTNSYELYVGNYGTGTLRIEAGGQVSTRDGDLGNRPGSSGSATVIGTGSKWTNSNSLSVGTNGVGTLRIEAGGQVSNYSGYLGSSSTATVIGTGSKWTNSGDLYVGGNGTGTLTVADGGEVAAGTLYASLTSLLGNGKITATQGAVLDADLRFDTAHSARATLAFGSGGTLTVNAAGGVLGAGYRGNGALTIAEGAAVTSSWGHLGHGSGSSGTAIVTGTGSKWTNSSSLFVGRAGAATLCIEEGGQVSNSIGYLGYYSTCTATITGADSKWINSGDLYVGYYGNATLTIEAGGQVSDSNGVLGSESGSSGTAIVTGSGSMWTNSGILYIGDSGTGTLHIRDGGMATASSVSLNSQSLLTIDAGYGSNLRVGGGTGTITNYGQIRILTGSQPATGTQFSPIATGTWSGSGTNQALGGTWNATSHVFTVSQTYSGGSGTPVAVDLAQQQRVLVDDSTSGWTVGISFLSKTGTGNTFDFTATAIVGAELTALQGLLEPGQSILSGWNFTAVGSGYATGDPLYLSFGNGTGGSFTSKELEVWSFDGTKWLEFAASDLNFDGAYANFTATSLGCYAVSVPEPSTLTMLFILALSGLLLWRRRA